jgi:HK97 gp10 family phage protein
MAYGSKIEMKGFDEYLANIEKAGRKIVPSVKRAINYATDDIKDEMQAGADPHILTRAVWDAIEKKDAKQDGNYISGEVGVNPDKSPGAWHAVFQEYGAPTFPADPFIRPAFEKKRVRKLLRKILKQEGAPIE